MLTGIDSGVIVVDQDLVVQVWNHWSEDLWGLRSSEVEGKHLMNLDIGLAVTELLPTVRAALEGNGEPPGSSCPPATGVAATSCARSARPRWWPTAR